MPQTLEEAKKLTGRLSKHWLPRNQRFNEWYKLREMRDELSQPGQISIALNDARTLFDIALFFLSHRAPVVRAPLLGKSDAEQERSQLAEQALRAIQFDIDRRRFESGLNPWRRDLADFLLSTGWWAVSNMVPPGDGSSPPLFISDVHDPAEVYPLFGDGRTAAIAHIYELPLAVVQERQRLLNWEGSLKGDGMQTTTLTDYWYWEGDRLYNHIWVTGVRGGTTGGGNLVELKKPEEPEPFSEIPLKTGPVGGWAVKTTRTGDINPQKRQGESILESGRPIYDALNTWATLIMRKAHDAVEPTFLASSRGGTFTVSEEEITSGHVIPVSIDENLRAVDKPDIPISIGALIMPMLSRGAERAGISDLFFGNVQNMDLAGAGFAISLLEPNALSKLAPYARTIELIGGERDSGYIETWRTGSYGPIKLSGRSDDVAETRKVYFTEFDGTKMPESSRINWELKLATPNQLLQALSIGRQAIPTGDLIDIETWLENIAQVDDPVRVLDGIAKADMLRDPRVRAINAAKQMRLYAQELREQNDPDFAAKIDIAADDTLASIRASQNGQTDAEGILRGVNVPGLNNAQVPANAPGSR
jgi:hypothetical protein